MNNYDKNGVKYLLKSCEINDTITLLQIDNNSDTKSDKLMKKYKSKMIKKNKKNSFEIKYVHNVFGY